MKFSRYVRGISSQKPFPLSWLYQPIHIRSFSYIDSPISFFKRSGSHLSSRAVSSQVLSAASVLTIVFGMGTGVSPTRIATGSMSTLQFSALYFLCLSIRTAPLLSFAVFCLGLPDHAHSQDTSYLFAFSMLVLYIRPLSESGEPAPHSFQSTSVQSSRSTAEQ